MELNVEKLKQLMVEKAKGNYNEFSRLTNINVSHLYRIINMQNASAGVRTINKIIEFIKKEGLPIEDYIFLG